LKEAFFIEASFNLKLSRAKFPVVMRSLGIIQKTQQLYQIFDELEEKEMKWFDFLQAYIALRGSKGSYNELANAVYDLDK
jgi:Ca2+-binding EF-hand superfamily protein